MNINNDLIVMKFGGTSVGNAASIENVIAIIKLKCKLHKKPIVVVSAISQATNALHKIGLLAAKGTTYGKNDALNIALDLKIRHLDIAKNLIKDHSLLVLTEQKIDDYFGELNNTVQGIFLLKEFSAQSYAKIVALGELLSSTLIHAIMLQNSMDAVLIDAREFMFTDDNCFKGNPNFDLIKEKMPSIMQKHLQEKKIVLTQGFIANNLQKITTTLGREGSDFSAAIIGNVMEAENIEIWTDVDGIMTADPRMVKNATRIEELSFAEAAELTAFGAKVLHPATIAPIIEKDIPLRILNTFNYTSEGTLLCRHPKKNAIGNIRSIACKKDIATINILNHQHIPQIEFIKKLFTAIYENKISCDIAAVSLEHAIFITENKEDATKICDSTKDFTSSFVQKDKAIVALVGEGLNQNKNLINKILSLLSPLELDFISYGISPISIGLIIDKNNLEKTMQILHDEFLNT